MKYTLEPFYFDEPEILEAGKLPPRSYFIPYPDEESARAAKPLTKRYGSPLVRCLNGDWDFKFYRDPNGLPAEFDTDAVEFDRIDVPSCWQYRGFADPVYLNIRYPFRYDAPRVPEKEPVRRYYSLLDGHKKAPAGEFNSVGVYRTFFDCEDLSKRRIISFLGVCSCLHIYLNGRFVGYSEESHNTAEFDLSGFCVEGRNELVAVVHRWCTGSYLECQDMFRNNGIFRDVLLREDGPVALWDLNFTPKKRGDRYDALVELELSGGDTAVTITLRDSAPAHEARLLDSVTLRSVDGKIVYPMKDLEVTEWNAEQPVLYELTVSLEGSAVAQKVGFKEVSIRDQVFCLNGRPVKLLGVNHHDTDPENGWCMKPEEILRDLRLAKQYNCNTVRTSHYAPDPLLIELAAELGLYLVDECDLETHGVQLMKFPYNMNALSDDPNWRERYLSRIRRHYHRDKLAKTPVVMWSLGNESGGGCNTEAMYRWLKQRTDIPVHYESAYHGHSDAVDVDTRMYTPVAKVREIGAGKTAAAKAYRKPFFLCEYAHAMGVGPGNCEAYTDAFWEFPKLMGGCIWEMNDHAVRHEDGSYTYGGDHGEWIHDGNFCVDGLFYPDRTPSTGAKIMKHAYRPLRFSYSAEEGLGIFNTQAFTGTDGFRVELRTESGFAETLTPALGPWEKTAVPLELPESGESDYLTVETYDAAGELRDVTQFTLKEVLPEAPAAKKLPEGFRLEAGRPVWTRNGVKLETASPYTLLFRAQTDNDKLLFLPSAMEKWYGESEKLVSSLITETACTVVTRVKAGGCRFEVTDLYQGCDDGVYVESTVRCLSGSGYLPRFAKSFRLDPAFDRVSWFGRREESYLDMKEHTSVGLNRAKVARMTEPNLRPQESGNRADTQFAVLSDGTNKAVFAAVGKPFELGVKPYSDRELLGMKHREDEKQSGCYVTLSAFQQGIGTGSCGPATLKEHKYPVKGSYTLRFILALDR